MYHLICVMKKNFNRRTPKNFDGNAIEVIETKQLQLWKTRLDHTDKILEMFTIIRDKRDNNSTYSSKQEQQKQQQQQPIHQI